MIITVKVELIFGGFSSEEDEECVKVVEIDSSSNLDDLHIAIQEAVGFDNDHLYEFFIANTFRSMERRQFNDENNGLYEHTLEDLFPLPKGKSLFYLFDYGDNWNFRVSKTRHKAKLPLKGAIYPRVIEEFGVNPVQYPEYE
ncbi:plasmid pRiA4b ORF-3 family protein [Oleiphilus messinensis]|uniref:Plasmid pRiA4b ORF-3 family protein n=1 Tax=Oleiphilus messinensis TaxID=141451 RepID=A0A1Y0IC86_9GAMM|nr:hypothetical protein [Oleiphilus messinensis]ARU57075.1 plasmid pRiA4b ORF-3 family protein [Oleiphilus messinensis]